MWKFRFAGIAIACTIFAQVSPAGAQATRTWLSGVGDDANPCSRTAPCKTFAGAISKTAAGGEINIVDAGAFGIVTITKSISLVAEGFEAGVLSSGANGITVNAGPTDVVVLRGLDINGAGTPAGLNGVRFIAGGALHIEKCQIRNFQSGSASGFGVMFAPGASASASLFITDTVITRNGITGTGGGIQIKPTGAAKAFFVFNRVEVNNNTNGVVLDGTTTTGGIFGTMRDSVAATNAGNGVSTTADASGKSVIFLERTALVNNGGNGLLSNGSANAIGYISGSTITMNNIGLAANSGGLIISFTNNNLAESFSGDGAPTNNTPLK